MEKSPGLLTGFGGFLISLGRIFLGCLEDLGSHVWKILGDALDCV